MVIVHLPGRSLSGFWTQLRFFLLLPIPLSRCLWFSRFNDYVEYLANFQTVYYPGLGDNVRLFVVNPGHRFVSSSCIFCSNRLAFLCSSKYNLGFFTCFSILGFCRSFLICVSNLIFNLDSFSCSSRELRFFHRLISLRHR